MSIRTLSTNVFESRRTGSHRHMVAPRVIAGLPLLFIGLIHVVDPELRMDPLVEAAGLPFVSVLAPLAVAAEIVAGVSLLLGAFARIGALIAIPTMLVAVYAHLTIDVWPNGAENEPPIVLPIAVALCAAYVLWRGAGRWSVDRWRAGR
jgi:putative oxidoreductase